MTEPTTAPSPRAALIDALMDGRPLSRDEAIALAEAASKADRLDGWRSGFHQADTDALHEAWNNDRPSANERGVNYTIEEGSPDGYKVWRIVRHLGANHREVTSYRHPLAADRIASALNHAARHED